VDNDRPNGGLGLSRRSDVDDGPALGKEHGHKITLTRHQGHDAVGGSYLFVRAG
jgi:hypothetical protein